MPGTYFRRHVGSSSLQPILLFIKIMTSQRIISLYDGRYVEKCLIAFLWVNVHGSVYAETHHFIPNFIPININFTFTYRRIDSMVIDEAHKYLNNCLYNLRHPNFSVNNYIFTYEILLTQGILEADP